MERVSDPLCLKQLQERADEIQQASIAARSARPARYRRTPSACEAYNAIELAAFRRFVAATDATTKAVGGNGMQ